MNTVKLFMAMIFLMSFTTIQAQKHTQTVRGIILDSETKMPLIGANVLLLDVQETVGATTDIDGKFKLENVEVGRISLQVTYLGYDDRMLSNIVVISGKETVLTIELIEKAFETDEVVVTASKQGKAEAINEMAIVSARQFTIEESRRYAGARDDVSRMAANYAGVSGANDSRNDIIIRGNSPLGLLWRMEGMDIPNPNHFGGFGSSGGPVSILNNNVLSNSDFYTGAFPAEYGNALSGVFDLKMRNGNNEQYEFMGQIGFNGVEAGAEGPINREKGSSFLANYRYSTLGLFDLVGISFGYVGIPQYQDLAFKVNLPNTKAGNFVVYGVGGTSSIAMLDSEREDGELNITGNDNQDLINATTMGTFGISHRYLINNHSYTNLTIAANYQQEATTIDDLDSSSNNPNRFYDANFIQKRLSARFVYSNKISARHTFRTGATANYYINDFSDSARINDITNEFQTIRSFAGNSYLLQAFAQSKYKLTERLTMVGGVYGQYFLLNNTSSVEPRLAFQFKADDRNALSLAFGRHSQLQSFGVYFDESNADGTRSNEDLDFTFSNHFVFGYDRNLGQNFRFKSEAYYQHITNAPVRIESSTFSLLNYGADFGNPSVDSLVNDGLGRNYGIELTLEKFFSDNYYFLVTTSLFESKYQGSDNVWRNTVFNTNYVVNALFGMEFPIGNNNILSFDLKTAFAGGRRFTPIDEAASIASGETVFVEDKTFEEQFKPYIKPDIKVSFRNNNAKYSQIWSVSIENVINRDNIFRQYFAGSELRTEYQLGLFPVFQYRIEF
ncbi:MAG: carboxypeptidase-like regulatory domain-containing protein [Saprospiraceae bacterium]